MLLFLWIKSCKIAAVSGNGTWVLSRSDLVCVCVCASVSSTAGMNMTPVSRLKKTWAKVKTAKFDILEVRILFLSHIKIFMYDLESS